MEQDLFFIGHISSKNRIDDIRAGIERGLSDWSSFRYWFADDSGPGGHFFQKTQQAIDRAFYCLFELSRTAAEHHFLEIGYAIGRRKPCLFLVRSGTRTPRELERYDRLTYESQSQLTSRLHHYMSQVMAGQQESYETAVETHNLDNTLLLAICELLMSNGPQLSAVIQSASRQGIAPEKVLEAFELMSAVNILRSKGDRWEFTQRGKRNFAKFIMSIRNRLRLVKQARVGIV